MKICEVPLTVNIFSQGNIESLTMVSVSVLGLAATVVLSIWFFRKPGAWRKYPRSAAWYVAIAAIQIFIIVALFTTMGPFNRGVSRRTLEETCGVSHMHAEGGKVFAWLEDPGYPYLGDQTRYGPIWFDYDGETTSGGVTLQNDTAALYVGEYSKNIDVNVHDVGETMLTHLFFMALVMLLMLLVAFIMNSKDTLVRDAPYALLITWLCVFIAAIMTAVSVPVVDARWVALTAVVLIMEDAVAFTAPFIFLRWLRSRKRNSV